MTKRWFIFSLFCITACLPQPKSDVQKAQAELVIQGRVLHSSEAMRGPVAVYIEQEAAAEALAADDGSFSLSLDESRLEALRLQYGLTDSRLHLYFQSENGLGESAVLDSMNIQNRGIMNLGDVQLQAEVPVTGRVLAYGSPVADARVRLGRKELTTASDGSFSFTLPNQMATPILIEKKGFVQTHGTWLPGDQERSLELYSDLKPSGSISASSVPREASNQPISLSYSANTSARWIRFASNPALLDRAFVADAPWLDLREPLQISSMGSVIYYQFADREQTILGPVLSYSP